MLPSSENAVTRTHWRSRRVACAALALFLFALNAWLAWRLFWLDYSIHMGSVEGTFLSIARYTRDHWPHLGWWPLWYCGMPYANTYQPLIPTVVAAVSSLGHINVGRAYHMVLGFAYALGPVTLFGLAVTLTRRLGWSLGAALMYSLISPSALLIPAVRTDLGGAFLARRLHTAAVYADGPHVMALTLVPLAVVMLHRALDRMSITRYLLAAVTVAAVFLTNVPGAMVLAMLLAAYAVAYCVTRRNWMHLAGIVGTAMVLSALWVPPSTVATNVRNTRWMEPTAGWDFTRAALLCGLAATGALVAWFLKKHGGSKFIQFAFLFLLVSGAVVLGKFWAGVTFVAQPTRFHLAFEMALILLVVFAAAEYIPRSRFVLALVCGMGICAAAVQVVHYRNFARLILRPVTMEHRSEFKVARWLDQHAGGARVLVPGSDAFWLNAFTDTPQIIGCCDQGLLMRPLKMAYYAIGSDEGAGDRAAEISIVWLQALGARYVAVSGPNSTEVYKDIAHPGKFRDRLREVFRDGDDIIYEVPQRTAGLAHVVKRSELIASVPENGIRIEPLLNYVSAIESRDRPAAEMLWQDPQHATIRTRVEEGEVISVQVAWHPGWRATVRGAPRTLFSDPLGFIVIDPKCTGECAVSLQFGGGAERLIVRGFVVALGLLVFAWWLQRRRQRPFPFRPIHRFRHS